ncbi:MAG: NADH-quinone oxidoreductase subunit NuoK [bacterium]|nr:NADH-quinone oxidoreductase subunit NuoK [bacterium]
MIDITLYHYLFVGLVLFVTGLTGSIICKNVIKVLICIEFILTGVNINFVAFATYCGSPSFDGYIMALFYIAIGAVEFALALYIFYLMYGYKKSDKIDNYGDL